MTGQQARKRTRARARERALMGPLRGGRQAAKAKPQQTESHPDRITGWLSTVVPP